MLNKRQETHIFSFDRQPAANVVLSDTEPYLPFAEAWKEFDSLQKTVQGRGRLSIIRHLAEFLFFLTSLGLIEFRPSKGFARVTAVGFGVLMIAELFHWFMIRRRFQHWPCPRCNTEWPGDKNEKDSACRVCGLHFHQLSP
jgi:hypothetical protein